MMVGAALMLLGPAATLAQTQTPASPSDARSPAASTTAAKTNDDAGPGFIAAQDKDKWLASKNLIGASVTGPSNQTVGKISDLLVDHDGKIIAAVIGVGGFLGIGEKDVAVPFKSLDLTRDGDNNEKVAFRFTKDELKQAPTFAALAPPAPKTATAPAGRNPPPGTGMAGPGGPQPRH
jgi:hypothetical protein